LWLLLASLAFFAVVVVEAFSPALPCLLLLLLLLLAVTVADG